MQFYYEPSSRSIVVANGAYGNHPAQVLQFDVGAAYHAPVFKNIPNKQGGEEGTFDYVNAYIQSLTPQQQAGVMDWFSRVHVAFYNTVMSMHEDILETAFSNFLQLNGLDPHSVTEWLKINLPAPNLMREYSPDEEGIYSRAKTYIYQEYVELAGLSLYMKMLLPVFGEYIRRSQIKFKADGDSVMDGLIQPYIEQRLLSLMRPMFTHLNAVDRLERFIAISTANAATDLTEMVISKKISEEDLPDYMLAAILARKLPSGAMFGNESNHLASRLATSIRSLIAPTGRETYRLTTEGVFKEGSEDVKGVYDDTYAHYSLSAGQIAIIPYSATEEYLLPILKLDVQLYKRLLNEALKQAPYLNMFHTCVISSVMAKHFTPVILSHCDAVSLLKLAVMTHMLIVDEFPDIAQLVLASPKIVDGKVLADHVSLNKLNGVAIKQLEQAFPIMKNRNTLYITAHIEEIREAVQFVWQSLTPPFNELPLDSNFLSSYANFICKAPLI